jgi:hypothetical protein
MFYGAEFAFYSQINTKRIKYEHNVQFLNVKPVGASRNQ